MYVLVRPQLYPVLRGILILSTQGVQIFQAVSSFQVILPNSVYIFHLSHACYMLRPLYRL